MNMSVPVWAIIAITALYMALLFGLAYLRDEKARQRDFHQHPMIYALALGVYCTSWTFYGAAGTAATNGWDYLPIYLGPALVFVLFIGVVRRVVAISRHQSITSLSDFLSARYGKSQSVAVIATLAAVMGSLPYIALQLKSVGMSFEALIADGATLDLARPNGSVLLTALALAAFAIAFGTRHADNTQRNAGLMRVLAFESIIKLAALAAVAVLAMVLLAGVPAQSVAEARAEAFDGPVLSSRFITITLLSMAAVLCLPRQFHVAIIEFGRDRDLATARWAFPLYLAATSAVVLPIAMAGLTLLPETPGDLMVIQLPLSQGQGLLAFLVFLGGFSAATGMVIVSTIALSSMVTNDLLVPALMRAGIFDRMQGNAGERLVWLRRATVIGLMSFAYLYYLLARDGEALAATGLLSFAAAVQFAPPLLAALYWPRAHRTACSVEPNGCWPRRSARPQRVS